MQNKIYLKEVIFTNDKLDLTFSDNKIDYAWLENINKHLPDIIELNKTENHKFSFPIESLELFYNVILKLSISSEFKKIKYTIAPDLQIYNTTKYEVFVDNDSLKILCPYKIESINYYQMPLPHKISFNVRRGLIHNKYELPLKVIVVGSCFSRNVLKSSSFFNPDYKDYFSVCYTAFHNSFISLMSSPYHDESYFKIEDLLCNEVFRYIEVEFKKDFFDTVDKITPDFIFIDNYVDATRPIIRITDDCYLTYNKYFSESIYKRKFSGLKVIYPGTKEHQKLYRASINKFQKELKKRNLDTKLILLGGRLSKKKKDKVNGITEIWTDKLSWINKSNENWNIVDYIFLKENKNALYIDMRNTNWMSDVASPIIGGASPSHYESEYYREIYNNLKKICFGEN